MVDGCVLVMELDGGMVSSSGDDVACLDVLMVGIVSNGEVEWGTGESMTCSSN